MRRKDHGGLIGNGTAHVINGGNIGSAHLDEEGAALINDIGNAKAPPDLDQFSPGYNKFFAPGKLTEKQEDTGSVVINNQRILGTGKMAEELLGKTAPFPPFFRGNMVLKIAVTAHLLRGMKKKILSQGGAPEIGMNDNPRAVDYLLQASQGLLITAFFNGGH